MIDTETLNSHPRGPIGGTANHYDQLKALSIEALENLISAKCLDEPNQIAFWQREVISIQKMLELSFEYWALVYAVVAINEASQ